MVRNLCLLVLALCPLVGRAASADEVVLKNGRAHDVEILETSIDSVSVKFASEKASGTLKLLANDMDPHSFYAIRSGRMEKTATNHLELAKYCAENGMFTRAKNQVERARKLDAKYVEEKLEMPGLIEGVAAKILRSARHFLKKGDHEKAERYASVVMTEFAETPAAEKAAALIDEIEKNISTKESKRMAVAAKKAEKANSATKEAFENEIRPLSKAYEKARQLNIVGLKEKSATKSLKMFETAAKAFEALINKGKKLEKKYADNEPIRGELSRALLQVTVDAVEAWVNAGGVELGRSSLKNAKDYGKKAIGLDPSSSTAISFLNRVQLAEANSDRWWKSRRR